MPVFDTVLWDWNGTLLDDAALCCELLNTMLARHGYAPVGSMEPTGRSSAFPSRPITAGRVRFFRHPFAALADEYMRLYTPRSLGCPLQPDACAVLDAACAGHAPVMLSASKRENLQQQVEHFGLRSRFDTLLGLSDIYAKSKTEVGLRWLRESGADPARIMMVGDSEHDFEVARALGVRCVLFSGGHQPREVLAATGAPVIDALAQLLPLLAQLAAE
ncbi:MAG: HAD family hydrolase [Ruthenibacterium lactatiformans]